jgi:hypothetical protein
MEATLGISLYSSLYLKLAKMPCFSYLLCFSFNKIREERETGSALKQEERGGGPNNVYTCKYM